MPAKSPKLPRNYQIAPGLQRFSRGRLYHKKGLFIKLKKPFEKKQKKPALRQTHIEKPVSGDKNGDKRSIPIKKAPKILSVAKKTVRIHRKSKVQALRKSITPGTILIILVGRNRGKRVVFLKQLKKSGLLLVTGPLKLNNTPLRRIAQSFVIATQTKLDISNVEVPDHITDDYFRRQKFNSDKSKNGIFATGENSSYAVTQQRKDDQKKVDAGILTAIRKCEDKKYLFGYLGSRFSLKKGDFPHKMIF